MPAESLADRLDQRIAQTGPIPVSDYVEAALYDDAGGFYTAGGGRAGRRGDFLTAPEVGPLFGLVVAAAVDTWWRESGSPAEFVVHEWGAGPGTLARAIIAAAPEVLRTGALRWHLIERSSEQRVQHPQHPQVDSRAQADSSRPADVVLANELLDNLPFDVYELTADGGWQPVLVDRRTADGRFGLVIGGPGSDAVPTDVAGSLPEPRDLPLGTRVPWLGAARRWLREMSADASATPRRVVVFDYGASTAELALRAGGWLRTHAAHDGAGDWLMAPGSCDITTDVAFDQLTAVRPPSLDLRQDEWLRRHGIEVLVEEGRRVWEERAAIGDLAALRARSRTGEAGALLEPGGMGAFRVLEWHLPPQPDR